MAASRGKSDVTRFFSDLPAQIEQRLLRGAGRAAANVVAAEARDRSISKEVSAAVKVEVKSTPGRVVAKVVVKGPHAYIGRWLERGTSPHYISVDTSVAGGQSAARINRLDIRAAEDGRAGPGASLVIGGKFVGATVHHPGARAHPFLLPAFDIKAAEAIAAAQAFVTAGVTRAGVIAPPDREEEP